MLLSFSLLAAMSLAATIQDNRAFDIDLVSMIQDASKARPMLVDRGIQLVQSLKSAPSCHRLAAATLIDSCKGLESPRESANMALDAIKSTFAARLAVCEISGAHASIPEQCLSMLPQPDASRSHSLRCRLPGSKCGYGSSDDADGNWGYTHIDEPKLKRCLKAFESRPQWWTSYSNARQNAVVLCHAARHELERDETLRTFTSLVATSAQVSDALNQAAQDGQQHLAQQRKFAMETALLQKQLATEITANRGAIKFALQSLFHDAEKSMHTLLSAIQGKSQDAGTSIDKLHHKIRSSHSDIEAHHASLAGSLQQLQSQMSEESRVVSANLEKSARVGAALDAITSDNLERLQQTALDTQAQMAALVRVVLEFHDRLASSEHGIDMLSRTMAALHAQSHTLESGFSAHVGSTQAFWAAQHAATQQQIAALAAAQASADALAAAVDAQAVRMPGVLAGLVAGAGASWTWSALVFLLPWGLERTLGRGAAGVVVAAFATCIVFYSLLWRLATCGGVVAACAYIANVTARLASAAETMHLAVATDTAAIAVFLFAVVAVAAFYAFARCSRQMQTKPAKGLV